MKLRAVLLIAALCSLFGCGRGGYLPGSPHVLGAGRLDSLVSGTARAYGVDPKLVAAVIDTESHGDPAAISRAGAVGLMQLMPATSAQYGVVHPFDPQENVDGGTRYLRDLIRRYHGNLKLALAAYNAGPGSVDAARGVPAFAETQAYVARVIGALR